MYIKKKKKDKIKRLAYKLVSIIKAILQVVIAIKKKYYKCYFFSNARTTTFIITLPQLIQWWIVNCRIVDS